jgi:hypothetical protein
MKTKKKKKKKKKWRAVTKTRARKRKSAKSTLLQLTQPRWEGEVKENQSESKKGKERVYERREREGGRTKKKELLVFVVCIFFLAGKPHRFL